MERDEIILKLTELSLSSGRSIDEIIKIFEKVSQIIERLDSTSEQSRKTRKERSIKICPICNKEVKNIGAHCRFAHGKSFKAIQNNEQEEEVKSVINLLDTDDIPV